ncbi:MAG: hypothetical protein IPH84_18250 [Bacteroidales bacterium]|nr:hypothetical protein [Bacteroidales bacterium]
MVPIPQPWVLVHGPSFQVVQATFSDNTDPDAVFTADAYGTYVLRWSISNGTCTASTADVTVNYYQAPTTASVGADQNHCATLTSTGLGGNTPVIGTGAWSIVSGGTGTFTAPTSGNSNFVANAYGTYVLRWTISNGTCAASTDDITVTFYQAPTTATVGADQSLCGTLVSAGLGGNTPVVGTGAWSIVSGGTGAFSSTAAANATFTADAYGVYVLRWTISNGVCTASTADVTVTFFESPVVSNAGPAQNLCNVTNTTLAGNDPTPGTGLWTLVSGPNTPAITTPTAYNSTVTSMVPGVYVFKWTISNGVCTPSESTVTITNYATPTTALAGADQNLCGTLVSAGLGANTPANGTGAWSIVSGGTGTFSSAAAANATFTADAYGVYVLRWTISNGVCAASTDDVTVTYYESPTTATVGANQNVCASLVSAGLGANTPTVGTGAWSVVSGGTGTFSDNTDPDATFTADAYGTYVLRWSISNGTCTPSTADVTVNYYQAPTTASVGADQNHCATLTSTGLGGNTPVIGTGAWSIVSGGTGTFTAPTSGNSNFVANAYGTYVLRWSITNGTCAASTDDITVTFYQAPTTATVGADQSLCGTLVSAGLGGNTPTVGTGAWSIVSGGTGAFSSTAAANATFTADAYGVYVLRWTISNGVCTASTADVTVTFFESPVVSNAGPAQNLCNVTNTTLAGNDPTPGTGLWTLVSGPNSPAITTPAAYNSTVTSMVPGVYVFKWTISNGVCTPSESTVTITNYATPYNCSCRC